MNISQHQFSKLFWNVIFSQFEYDRYKIAQNFSSELASLDGNREQAQYNTGSISLATSIALYALTKYVKPKVIAEVGTFIGRSTFSMAKGVASTNLKDFEIHTCDYSNDIRLAFYKENIHQYPLTSSQSMFSKLLDKQKKVDMFFLDGRVSAEELPYLAKLSNMGAIYVFDDFEGIEKGVANYGLLKSSGILKDYVLVYPPTDDYLAKVGVNDNSVMALAYPLGKLRFVAQ